MKRPLLLLALIPLGLWGIFALPGILAANPETLWDWRRSLIVLSGILALWWMSCGVVLASRPAWLDKRLGGLDRLYLLHKNIGIGAGLLVFTHWMLEWLPKNLAKLGWIPGRPRPRGPRGEPDQWIELAKEVGEWAGYILLALVVIALIRRIPYRYFRWVHKAFGAIFLAGVFPRFDVAPWQLLATTIRLADRSNRCRCCHSRPAFAEQPDRPQTPASCSNRGYRSARQSGTGNSLPPASRLARPSRRPISLRRLRPARRRGSPVHHCFRLESATRYADAGRQGTRRFHDQAPELLHVGRQIVLEGPYGSFDFGAPSAPAAAPQVWIAGGIGITPFLARLNEIAGTHPPQTDTDFFYCTPESGDFPEHLEALCHTAGVRLHQRLTAQEGPLSAAEVEACLKPGSSVWFCGPAGWGHSLAKTLIGNGLPDSAFHQEAFEFR